MEGRIQAFAGMDERAMGGQVRNLSLQKRDTIVFNLPVNTVFRRYGDNTVWMILMCV
jgi:hypothetical protein